MPASPASSPAVEPIHAKLEESVRSTVDPRRHDLDALRAFAMLLGIALHAAISFIPDIGEGWAIEDTRTSPLFATFLAAVHGFRMPLFFLVSGFFTAMLWQRRGLKALLWHRVRRILFPLMLGMVTIIPLVWFTIIPASIYSSSIERPPREDLVAAIRSGDSVRVKAMLAESDVNRGLPPTGVRPLTVAAAHGQYDVARQLVKAGAGVNRRNADGTTAAHGAVLFGRFEVVKFLDEQGIDWTAKDNQGRVATDGLRADLGMTQFLSQVMQIPIERDSVLEGRQEIAAYLASKPDSNESLAKLPENALAVEEQPAEGSLGLVYILLTMFPFYHHLWFLHFLCWFVALFGVAALAISKLKLPGLPNWMVHSPVRYLWLISLTMLPQSAMSTLIPNYGPDTSAGILPMPHLLLYYGIFFFFGAIYFHSDDSDGRVGAGWWLLLPLAMLCVFPVGYDLTMGAWGWSDTLVPAEWRRPLAGLMQVTYTWMMTFGMMGLFRRYFQNQNDRLRYVSDSSYWLYLVHLPLVILLQCVVATWPLPAWMKFIAITVVTSVILLMSYRYLVRYTFIGTFLNGPRKRPNKSTEQISAPTAV